MTLSNLDIKNRYCVAYMQAKGGTLLGVSWEGDNGTFHFPDDETHRRLRSEYSNNEPVPVLTYETAMEDVWDIIMQHRRNEGRGR